MQEWKTSRIGRLLLIKNRSRKHVKDDPKNQEELETTGLVETKPEENIPILVLPKTGDMAKPGIYLAGTILSFAAILLLLYLIRRRKE